MVEIQDKWTDKRKKSYFCAVNIEKSKAKMIDNFPNPRRKHCETGTFLNMLDYYGYQIDEAMAFGIGSGIYFLYSPFLRMRGIILPMLRIKPPLIVKKFCERMNLGYHGMEYGHQVNKAMRSLDELVDRNVPVGVVASVGGLNYFGRIVNESNMNGHVFTVVGKEGSVYSIADSDSRLITDEYVSIDEPTMRKVRFATGLAAPRGKMFYIDPLPDGYAETVDLKKAILQGIDESCYRMLRIPITYYGYTGLHCFATSLKRWKIWFSKELQGYILLWFFRLIETAGTGGAGYRYMYADFLKQASEIFQSEVLFDSSQLMEADADTWRQFSLDCRRYMKSENVTLKEMAEVLETIGEQERVIFTKIDKEFLKPHLKQ